jgi:hypothetical protein
METGFDRLDIHWQEVSRFVNFSETRQRREGPVSKASPARTFRHSWRAGAACHAIAMRRRVASLTLHESQDVSLKRHFFPRTVRRVAKRSPQRAQS